MRAKKIDALEALTDLRQGMSNAEIMGKYSLSYMGLKSLYRQLQEVMVELQVPEFPAVTKRKQVKAREVLKDIQAGYSPDFLREKYKLSSSGLKSLYTQLEKAGLFSNHSGRQLRVKELAQDIRKGLLEPDLMELYNLTLVELKWVLNSLIISKFLEPEEIAFLEFARPQSDDNPLQTRFPVERFEICEVDNPKLTGEVQYIRGSHVCVEGMFTRKGETKSVFLRCASFQNGELPFDVKCEWVISGMLANFRIVHIAPAVMRDLIRCTAALTKVFCEENDEFLTEGFDYFEISDVTELNPQ